MNVLPISFEISALGCAATSLTDFRFDVLPRSKKDSPLMYTQPRIRPYF
jgi:hypothetical protein